MVGTVDNRNVYHTQIEFADKGTDNSPFIHFNLHLFAFVGADFLIFCLRKGCLEEIMLICR